MFHGLLWKLYCSSDILPKEIELRTDVCVCSVIVRERYLSNVRGALLMTAVFFPVDLALI